MTNTHVDPDPSGIQCEVNGLTWYRFSASYFDGSRDFVIHLWALDFDDAERRLARMRSGLTLDGQDISEGNDGRRIN